MQHGDVWRALDEIATRKGLTPSGLAKLAGLDATAFNKSKRVSKGGRPRWPSTESIARALEAANVDYTEFASLVAGPSCPTIPFLELPDATRSGLFNDLGLPDAPAWDAIEFPGPNRIEGCFALEVTDRDLEPIYRAGDRLISSCQADIRSGDRVVLKTTKGQICIGVVARQTAKRLDLNSIADGRALPAINVEEIDWMARIIWVSQ
ncbi:MAG: helix-turn-helix transcriptional regulator [Henriciella sp.]|nr:helix-turn-helix transcriptional regulator [Henriciella sp.]